MNTPILKVENLTTKLSIDGKPYTIVDGISFELHKGKTLALVGESGCGKSLTALSIMRILPEANALPLEGAILYKDENLITLPEKKMRQIRGAQIAMIFQDPTSALNPVYTIGDQLMEVAQLHLGLDDEEAYLLAKKSLEDLGIPSAETRLADYPHQMSGGMKQRVMIAMALMCEPDVLIADEPTTALDVTIQAQVLELIRDLQKRRGMALLLITHDMGVVAEMADEVMVMYASQVVEKGGAEDVFDNMSHPYTIGLFNSNPTMVTAYGTKLNAIKGTVPPVTRYPAGCRFHPRCPFVMEKCRTGVVPNFEIKKEHKAKCWLRENGADAIDR